MSRDAMQKPNTTETVLRAKAMLAIGMGPKEVSQHSPMGIGSLSLLKCGRTYQDVDASKAAAAKCIGCGRVLVDPLDECIYIVATDEYACSQKCIDKSAEQGCHEPTTTEHSMD